MPSPETSTTARLVDGTAITLRRLLPEDRDDIVALAQNLTARERYLRFFTAHPGYLDDWVRSLVDLSPGRFTLGAYESRTLVGLANYVETAQPGYAEVAIVVAHGQHQRGVGTALLTALGRIALANGEHHFVADVLAENHDMQKVLVDAGWQWRRHLDGTIFSVEVDLEQNARQ